MNCYSPLSWLHVHGFLSQNSKHWIFEVFAGNLEKRISVQWLIPQPFLSRFSKFLSWVTTCKNRHLFLFHKQLPIVHRLDARRRQSDEGLSRQFFRAKNPKFSILSYKHDIYLK